MWMWCWKCRPRFILCYGYLSKLLSVLMQVLVDRLLIYPLWLKKLLHCHVLYHQTSDNEIGLSQYHFNCPVKQSNGVYAAYYQRNEHFELHTWDWILYFCCCQNVKWIWTSRFQFQSKCVIGSNVVVMSQLLFSNII